MRQKSMRSQLKTFTQKWMWMCERGKKLFVIAQNESSLFPDGV